jgi:hypothetical protein
VNMNFGELGILAQPSSRRDRNKKTITYFDISTVRLAVKKQEVGPPKCKKEWAVPRFESNTGY